MATIDVTEPWATRRIEAPTYVLSRWLFLRLLGVVYLVAFLSLVPQVTGLVGEHGLLPARPFLDRASAIYGGAAYRLFPTLCWLGASDATLQALCWAGVALALLLIAGVAQVPVLLLLWVDYLSLSVAGQTFLWFQWDALLLETGLLAILVIELGVPWLILAPQRWRYLRYAGCALLVAGQLAIALTGNYGFFNLLAIVLCVPLLDDAVLRRVLPLALTAGEPEPRWRQYAVRGLATVLAVLAVLAFAHEIAQTLPGVRRPLENPLLDAVAPLRSVNGYGLFRVMTTERPEIVIEGSDDTLHWREYGFPWKPGDVARRPRFMAPHMPRLDWQMWFAGLDPAGAQAWLLPLLRNILEGTPQVLELLGEHPFPARPP